MVDEIRTGRPTESRCKSPRRERAWRLAALLLAVLIGNLGCNPLSTFGFLVAPWSNTAEPKCPLTIPDKDSKVAIVCVHEDPTNVNLIAFRSADQEVGRQLASALALKYKENKDKITIVPAAKVNSYLRDHTNWTTQSKQELGKHLDADFLVYLELGPLTMYEPGSNGTLYHGNVPIHLAVFDVHQPEGEGPKYEQFPTCIYPTASPEDATGTRPAEFRAKFLDRITKDLMQYFVVQEEKNKMDQD